MIELGSGSGSGSGHNLVHLVAHHHAHGIGVGVGVDHDPTTINRATTCYGHPPAIRFQLADAAAFLAAIPPASADLILSICGAFSFADPTALQWDTPRSPKIGSTNTDTAAVWPGAVRASATAAAETTRGVCARPG